MARLFLQRKPFLQACNDVLPAVPGKDLKPVLKNFRLSASGGKCLLAATDLEIGVRVAVQGVEIYDEGEALIPAQKIVSILKEADDQQLELTADDDAVTVRGTASSLDYEMSTSAANEFPEFPTFPDDNLVSVNAGVLATMLKRTVFACADEAQRYSMTGILWELKSGALTLVGTDGRRLALATGAADGEDTAQGTTHVIPAKAINILERLLDEPEEDVRVVIRPNEAMFSVGGATLYTRLVEGRFPSWREVLPKSHSIELTVNAAQLLTGVKQAAIMADAEAPRVTFAFDDGKLTLTANGANSGRSKVEVGLDYGGPAVTVALNPGFLTDWLKIVGDNDVRVEMKDGASPVLMHCGEACKFLQMPLT